MWNYTAQFGSRYFFCNLLYSRWCSLFIYSPLLYLSIKKVVPFQLFYFVCRINIFFFSSLLTQVSFYFSAYSIHYVDRKKVLRLFQKTKLKIPSFVFYLNTSDHLAGNFGDGFVFVFCHCRRCTLTRFSVQNRIVSLA